MPDKPVRKKKQTIRPPNSADRAREAFIEKFRECCNVAESCRYIGYDRSTVRVWKEKIPEFAAAWADAEADAIDRLEREAWRRAVDGYDEPVVHQGVVVDSFKKYSDKMLEILLKGHKPEKYVERKQIEHSGSIGLEGLVAPD